MSLIVSEHYSERTVLTRECVEIYDERELAELAAQETRRRFGIPDSENLLITLTPIGAMVVSFSLESEVASEASADDDCGCTPGSTCKANSACPRNPVG